MDTFYHLYITCITRTNTQGNNKTAVLKFPRLNRFRTDSVSRFLKVTATVTSNNKTDYEVYPFCYRIQSIKGTENAEVKYFQEGPHHPEAL